MKAYPNIPEVFSGEFPQNYVNGAVGWGTLTPEELRRNSLLFCYIDFPCDGCSGNCPTCFRQGGAINQSERPRMSVQKTLKVVEQMYKLGCRYLQIPGDLEPFESYNFLNFLQTVVGMGITVGVFSTLTAFGSNAVAAKYHGHHGITTGLELARKVEKLKKVAVYGKYNSADPRIQDEMFGRRGYTPTRNTGLENLVAAGMNQGQPTRLAGIVAPVIKQNYATVLDTYKFLRRRGIFPAITTSMVCGRAKKLWPTITPPEKDIISLYSEIYIWNIENGITTLEELADEGVSPYAGARPCHIHQTGFYVTSSGLVVSCPSSEIVIGDVTIESLEQIWERYVACSGPCPPKDGLSIPANLYAEVMMTVVAYFS